MRVLYVFAGARKERFRGVPGTDYPDTQLYGLNHLAAHGINASFKEAADMFPGRLADFLGFRFRHLMMFFATFGYAIVFGSALMYMLFWRRLIPRKTKFIIFNISLVRLLESNKWKPLKRALIHWLLRGADGVVNLSRVQQTYLEEHCPYLCGRMRVILGNVDVNYYRSDRPRGDVLFAVGRDNGRDYRTLIEAARALPHERFEIACSERNLKGVGDVPGNVLVHIDLPFSQVKERLETAKALLLITHPDTHSDGADCSGQTVLVEAMAAGMPIIASEKGYLAEYAAPGKEAIVVPVHDAATLAAAIHALGDSALRARLGAAARLRAERALSSARMGKELADFFRSISV